MWFDSEKGFGFGSWLVFRFSLIHWRCKTRDVNSVSRLCAGEIGVRSYLAESSGGCMLIPALFSVDPKGEYKEVFDPSFLLVMDVGSGRKKACAYVRE